MKTGTILIAAASLLVGCVTPPQTSQELREGVKAGRMMTKMDHKDVNRPVNEVFPDVKKNADKCFNVRVTGSTPGTYGPQTQSATYRSRSWMTGKAQGEMVMQMEARASGKMPEGGYFVLLADTLDLARKNYESRVFIATAVAFDEEMKRRIVQHQKERGDLFHTIEEPVRLSETLSATPPGTEVALVDCLTVWVGNL